MPTINLTKNTFGDEIADNDTVIVDFRAEWCGPCRSFAPIFDKAADKHPDIVFGKVDTEAEAELASYFDVRSIPTLMVFREKVLVFNQAGLVPEPALESLISDIGALDMEDIHAQIAARESERLLEDTLN